MRSIPTKKGAPEGMNEAMPKAIVAKPERRMPPENARFAPRKFIFTGNFKLNGKSPQNENIFANERRNKENDKLESANDEADLPSGQPLPLDCFSGEKWHNAGEGDCGAEIGHSQNGDYHQLAKG